MDNFTTTVALIGIVIVVASLLSGALERTGLHSLQFFSRSVRCSARMD
jgi:hypothetical protein